MSQEVTQPIAEGSKQPVENKPMSESDYLSRRIAKLSGTPEPKPAPATAEPPKAEETKEPEPLPEAKPEVEAAPTEDAAEAKAKLKDVLSKDLDDMSEDELRELADKLGSKAVARFGELTYKRKAAEEQLAALKAELARRASEQLPEPKVENNPYATVDTIEALTAQHEEVTQMVEWCEDQLDRAADLGATDVAALIDGKEYTKADLRESLRNARKARDKFIPAQFKELSARQQRAVLEEQFKQTARKELPWMDGEDNDTRKQFEAMVKDPRLKRLKDAVPELAPQVEYLIAHAANSMFTRRQIETYAETKKPTLTPPSAPRANAAAPERADARTEKAVKDIAERFKQTGSGSDFIALRAAQISKRKS